MKDSNGSIALRQLLNDADKGNEAKVACGSCRACCHNKVVLLDEDPAEYKVEKKGEFWFLKHRADGGCIYLDDLAGCTIYERRPSICKAFHCGRWFATMNREYRRYVKAHGDRYDRQMLKFGRQHAERP